MSQYFLIFLTTLHTGVSQKLLMIVSKFIISIGSNKTKRSTNKTYLIFEILNVKCQRSIYTSILLFDKVHYNMSFLIE